MKLRTFVRERIGEELANAGDRLKTARDEPSEEHIHKFRVSLRRLRAVIGLFDPLLVRKKRVKRELRTLMNAAGTVRSHDIALGLVESSGVAGLEDLRARLELDRSKAERAFQEMLRELQPRKEVKRWRKRLLAD